jgi:hypothetical protein
MTKGILIHHSSPGRSATDERQKMKNSIAVLSRLAAISIARHTALMNGNNGFFLLLLALVLPLRVISAESMALSMAVNMTRGDVAAAVQATNPPQQSMEMDQSMSMEDCPFMGKAEQPPDGVHGQAQGKCQTCQICMVWATPPPLGRLPAAFPAAPTHAPGEDFASAVLTPKLRPPISGQNP